MKLGNVVLAIFLWILIPIVFIFGALVGALAGLGADGGVVCMTSGPLILFVLGFIVLWIGREKNKKRTTTTIEAEERIEFGYCPVCEREIPLDSALCPYCGQPFDE